MNTNGFSINQIVKGKFAGTFVIIGFRVLGNQVCAQVKTINPNNHAESAPGEMAFPLSALEAI